MTSYPGDMDKIKTKRDHWARRVQPAILYLKLKRPACSKSGGKKIVAQIVAKSKMLLYASLY